MPRSAPAARAGPARLGGWRWRWSRIRWVIVQLPEGFATCTGLNTCQGTTCDAANPLPPGHTVRLTGLTVTILETGPDGSPVRILFHFGRPLEDPTLRWLRWQDGVYVPFTPPVVGATVHLAPAVGPLERAGGRS